MEPTKRAQLHMHGSALGSPPMHGVASGCAPVEPLTPAPRALCPLLRRASSLVLSVSHAEPAMCGSAVAPTRPTSTMPMFTSALQQPAEQQLIGRVWYPGLVLRLTARVRWNALCVPYGPWARIRVSLVSCEEFFPAPWGFRLWLIGWPVLRPCSSPKRERCCLVATQNQALVTSSLER
jgi:hypothetical protein